MRSLFLAINFLLLSSQAMASDGAIYSKLTEKFLNKVGHGRLYENEKPLMRKDRPCVLTREDFETEATDRDVLMIGFIGKPGKNGLAEAGNEVNGKTFWGSGLIYDVAVNEEIVSENELNGWRVCYAKDNPGPFAADWKLGTAGYCYQVLLGKREVQLSEYEVSKTGKTKEIRSATCAY